MAYPSTYPATLDSYTTKTDNVDDVRAVDVNELQSAIVAIETKLGLGVYGNIAFPATQVPSAGANVLDDYEEGTWTPVLSFGGATTGITYSVQQGQYTKIGNQVTVQMYFTLSSKGSASGGAAIAGLPFASSGYPCPVLDGVTMNSIDRGILGAMSATNLTLIQQAAAGRGAAITEANFNNTSSLRVSFSYLV